MTIITTQRLDINIYNTIITTLFLASVKKNLISVRYGKFVNIFDYALRLFAPHACLVCYREGDLLCGECSQAVVCPLDPRCYRCLSPQEEWRVCSSCKPHTSLEAVWIATEHQDAARELIRALKFSRAQSAALVAADIMDRLLPPFPLGSVLVPVPTATARVRERGYDQAVLIARRLARLRGVPYKKLLHRHGTTRQVGAKRTQRQQQLAAAFSVAKPVAVYHPILIDDVVTTGATIEAAARVLKENGAHHVSAALFSQKSR